MKIVKPGFKIEDDIDGIKILQSIERAGRTCYKSEAKITEGSCREFVKKIIASGHHSVLEHEKVTVRVVCDRGVTHEIVRHRIASYSQESTRYCNYGKEGFGKEITVILPAWYEDVQHRDLMSYKIGEEEAFNRRSRYNWWLAACQKAEEAYLMMVENGASPQEARAVLPNSLKTEIVMTMNLREWRHFFTLRTAPSAHPQMREVARPMLDEFKRLIPVVFEDINYSQERSADCATSSTYFRAL